MPAIYILGLQGQSGLFQIFLVPLLGAILGVFLVLPVIMAAWVSVSDWTGRGSPFASGVAFVGVKNYRSLLVDGGLPTQDFGTAMRNNAWYVVLVVPIQTVVSLFLATIVNRKIMRGRGFFRTAFYFPSVTSSVAIVFQAAQSLGAIPVPLYQDAATTEFVFPINNAEVDPRGIVHVALAGMGMAAPTGTLVQHGFLGITWWEWLAGPSFAMSAFIIMAIFTTSGTFMLLFIAALQAISGER